MRRNDLCCIVAFYLFMLSVQRSFIYLVSFLSICCVYDTRVHKKIHVASPEDIPPLNDPQSRFGDFNFAVDYEANQFYNYYRSNLQLLYNKINLMIFFFFFFEHSMNQDQVALLFLVCYLVVQQQYLFDSINIENNTSLALLIQLN